MRSPIFHASLAELPHQARILVRISGDDALRFLQGLLTADVAALTAGTASPAALLTVKGKIISEVWVLAAELEAPWLALPAELAEQVIAKLDDHIIMDDVELALLPEQDLTIVWREGGRVRRSELGQLPASLRAFETRHPLPGFLIAGPAAAVADYASTLGEAAGAEAFTAARIAHARPAWGFELAPDHFPPEVGFVDAVSYEKGCYLGQEPLSRIHNRGQVNRVLVRVRVDDGTGLQVPVELVLEDGRDVGTLTSLAGGEGLAIVRRTAAQPGTKLATKLGERQLEVVGGPLGDDPGGGGRQASATVKLGGR